MDSATTSAPPTEARPRRGFTLAEVMIAAALGAFVLAAVLSAFTFLGRTGFRASGLSEMEAEVRRALESFAQETRAATDVRWNSAQSVTLSLPGGTLATYAYDSDPSSPTHRTLYRVAGAAGATADRRVLVRDVASDFTFRRYKLEQAGVSDNAATSDRETKQLQLVLRVERASLATAGVTQAVTSARYILRNKRVSN